MYHFYENQVRKYRYKFADNKLKKIEVRELRALQNQIVKQVPSGRLWVKSDEACSEAASLVDALKGYGLGDG